MKIFNILKFVLQHPLNRRQPFHALKRFIKWQICSRLHRGFIIFDWINGSKFMVKSSETGLTGNIYAGLHEFSDMSYLLHVLNADDLFVDVGANLGSYTILASAVIGAKGFAFEPVPETFVRLNQNVRLNSIENKVKCLQMGVGRENGNLKFTSNSDTTNHALADGESCENTIVVNVSTLNEILKDESPALIKIDTEGFETQVIEGALDILKKPSLHSVIIELNESGSRYGFDESKILNIMTENGFGSYSYDPFTRKLDKLDGKNLESSNTIFVRDIPSILVKLKSSAKFIVNEYSL
ncbi:MAG: FkbM family methyltransferase [Oleiphilaceae bacterium]|jgi:FkbM family methyltransferase